MSVTLAYSLMMSVFGGLLSLAVAASLTLGLPRRWLVRLVSFAAGVLLATASLDLLPEALASGLDARTLFSMLLVGVLVFFALEKAILWHQFQGSPEAGELASAAPTVLVGAALHNVTDGILISAAFLTSVQLGWLTALAVIAHEIPHEAGDFALTLAAGWGEAKAFLWNGLASLASITGALLGYFWLERARHWIPAVLTFAAASFLYIAISDLMPWLRRERGVWNSGFMAAGAALVTLGVRFIH